MLNKMTPELILSAKKIWYKIHLCKIWFLSFTSISSSKEFNITCYIGLDLSNKNYIDINNI